MVFSCSFFMQYIYTFAFSQHLNSSLEFYTYKCIPFGSKQESETHKQIWILYAHSIIKEAEHSMVNVTVTSCRVSVRNFQRRFRWKWDPGPQKKLNKDESTSITAKGLEGLIITTFGSWYQWLSNKQSYAYRSSARPFPARSSCYSMELSTSRVRQCDGPQLPPYTSHDWRVLQVSFKECHIASPLLRLSEQSTNTWNSCHADFI